MVSNHEKAGLSVRISFEKMDFMLAGESVKEYILHIGDLSQLAST